MTFDSFNIPESNFSFVLSCDHLVRIHPNPSVPEVNLIPISYSKFIYGDETDKTIELVLDKNGKVTGVVFEW